MDEILYTFTCETTYLTKQTPLISAQKMLHCCYTTPKKPATSGGSEIPNGETQRWWVESFAHGRSYIEMLGFSTLVLWCHRHGGICHQIEVDGCHLGWKYDSAGQCCRNWKVCVFVFVIVCVFVCWMWFFGWNCLKGTLTPVTAQGKNRAVQSGNLAFQLEPWPSRTTMLPSVEDIEFHESSVFPVLFLVKYESSF